MSRVRDIIDRLNAEKCLDKAEWTELFTDHTDADVEYAAGLARELALAHFGNKIYIRGLIEFSNYCRNDCLYCGIRRSNRNVSRYRLTKDEILKCCGEGYSYGFRTFVLQSGEDSFFTADKISDIVRCIKLRYPDCAVTLSLGEKSRSEYQQYRDAGADRYLLRHETADGLHYQKLHPNEMSLENRIRCLHDLKELGFQTGVGMMIGSPFQTADELAEDMLFISDFKPQMVGIGPFIPHSDTPFAHHEKGSLELTLFCLSLIRIMLPNVLLPATTALGTIHYCGREKGVLAGANVIMPNLSPTPVRKKYQLYDNKICTGDESAQCRGCIDRRMRSIGYEVEVSRGDHIG